MNKKLNLTLVALVRVALMLVVLMLVVFLINKISSTKIFYLEFYGWSC